MLTRFASRRTGTLLLFCLWMLAAAAYSFGTGKCTSTTRPRLTTEYRVAQRCRHELQRHLPLCMVAPSARGENPKGNENLKSKESLTVENVASMIEVSFVEGVMQLAQGYVETIKLFIASVLTGYGMSIPVDDLIDQVQTCPNQSANRPLFPEEEALRSTWIKLVYLMAHHVQYRQAFVQDKPLLGSLGIEDDGDIDGNGNNAVDWNMYQNMLPRLRQKHADGNETGPRFRAQEIWSQNANILAASSSVENDEMQKALVLQNLRLLWMTLTVMEEEKLCSTAVDADPPAPPIPNRLNK